jgi:hypothetical protein
MIPATPKASKRKNKTKKQLDEIWAINKYLGNKVKYLCNKVNDGCLSAAGMLESQCHAANTSCSSYSCLPYF